MNDSKYKVPVGFRPLLEALAREVLRNQPNDIYAFSALFFERLLLFRDGWWNFFGGKQIAYYPLKIVEIFPMGSTVMNGKLRISGKHWV
jgi:hypothetical protein